MEGGESPLDVLSRAATMVQENQALSTSGIMFLVTKLTACWPVENSMGVGSCVLSGETRQTKRRSTVDVEIVDEMKSTLLIMDVPNIVQELLRVSLMMRGSRVFGGNLKANIKKDQVFWQPWLDTDESSKQPNQKQTTKWKRDRRQRLPEYSRKSDPKISEIFGSDSSSSESTATNGTRTNDEGFVGKIPSDTVTDTPLDMSVRQRGLPPHIRRQSIIQDTDQITERRLYRTACRPERIYHQVSGISMCDPIIDEHFRRSLGNDYHTLFQNNNISKEQNPSKPPPRTPTTNVIELMDSTGLSVDDHFAKALGDTWAKLNKESSDASKNNLVST
ncbi:hypothetical protein NQ317_013035 [Molorchus minor]|uniref:Transcription cofactor vestigial-like protein 4 n=1 Tax=Molorchus minor TaxID=1323400 RepID=A0ABQ9K2K2_9CUCU|nr:hypothetical protein NQ317_013035 [Molorchus minor]